MITAAVDTAGMPFICSAMAMARAVVTLLGSSDAKIGLSSARKRDMRPTQTRLVAVPATTPAKMAGKFFFSTRTCS